MPYVLGRSAKLRRQKKVLEITLHGKRLPQGSGSCLFLFHFRIKITSSILFRKLHFPLVENSFQSKSPVLELATKSFHPLSLLPRSNRIGQVLEMCVAVSNSGQFVDMDIKDHHWKCCSNCARLVELNQQPRSCIQH